MALSATTAVVEGQDLGSPLFTAAHWRAVDELLMRIDAGQAMMVLAAAPSGGMKAAAEEVAAQLPSRLIVASSGSGAASLSDVVEPLCTTLGALDAAPEARSAGEAVRLRLEQLADADRGVVYFVDAAENLSDDAAIYLARLAAGARRMSRMRNADPDAPAVSGPIGARIVLLCPADRLTELAGRADGALAQAAGAALRLDPFDALELAAAFRQRFGAPLAPDAAEALVSASAGAQERLARVLDAPQVAAAAASAAAAGGAVFWRDVAAAAQTEGLTPAAPGLGVSQRSCDRSADADLFDDVDRSRAAQDVWLEDAQAESAVDVGGVDAAGADADGKTDHGDPLAADAFDDIAARALAPAAVAPGGAGGAASPAAAFDRVAEPAKSVRPAAAVRRGRGGARRGVFLLLCVAAALGAISVCAGVDQTPLHRAFGFASPAQPDAPADADRDAADDLTAGDRAAASDPAAALELAAALDEDFDGAIVTNDAGAAASPEYGGGAVARFVDGALSAAEGAARAVASAPAADSVGVSEDLIAFADEVFGARLDLAGGAFEERVAALSPAQAVRARDAAIVRAVAAARAHIAAGRYTGPEGGNAYETLLTAYAIDPRDPRVAHELGLIVAHYDDQARAALDDAQFVKFHEYNRLADRVRARRPI